MRNHYTMTFNVANQPQSNLDYFSKVALYCVFEEAIAEQDARNQRTQISEGLRLAHIKGIDGLDVLRQVLSNQHELRMKANTKKPNEAPKDVPKGDSSGFNCPKCAKEFGSGKALNAHRPLKCKG